MLLVVLWTGTAFPIAIVASSLGVSPNGGWGLLGGVGISVVVVGTALVLQRRWGTTYVGERGVARTRSGAVGGRAEVLRFDQAAHLYVGRTADRLRNAELLGAFSKGAMIGWTYAYSWEDSRGRALMNLTGHLPDDRRPTRRGHPYHFARAADGGLEPSPGSWPRFGPESLGYRRRVPRLSACTGAITVRVGPGVVEFVVAGPAVRADRPAPSSPTPRSWTARSASRPRTLRWFEPGRQVRVAPSGRRWPTPGPSWPCWTGGWGYGSTVGAARSRGDAAPAVRLNSCQPCHRPQNRPLSPPARRTNRPSRPPRRGRLGCGGCRSSPGPWRRWPGT